MSVSRAAVAEMRDAGWSVADIAGTLGVAPATVRYHLSKLAQPSAASDASERSRSVPPADATRPVRTREQVQELLAVGLSRTEIATALGLSKSSVSYHARRLGEVIDERCARRYDWSAVQAHHDRGHSVRECMLAFGFSSASWFEAAKRGDLRPRPSALPIDALFAAGTPRGRHHLKLRLLREGLKQGACEICGIDAWRGQPISLALHHVNGQRDDNRLENLQLLCPNCHSQTDNFAGRTRAGTTRRGPPTPD